MGLSSRFPQVVGNLNDTIHRAIANPFGYGSFQGYKFTFQPDLDKPRIDVEEKRGSPYTVTIEADLLKRGTFSVEDKLKTDNIQHASRLNWVKLDALKDFASAYPGSYDIRFIATGIVDALKIDVSLDELSVPGRLDELGVFPDEHELKIGFVEDEHTQLLLPIEFTSHAGRSELNFGVGEIFAKAPAEEIEAIVNAYGNLLAVKYN